MRPTLYSRTRRTLHKPRIRVVPVQSRRRPAGLASGASAWEASGHAETLVADDLLDGDLAADGLEVGTDDADPRVIDVADLDSGDRSLADAEPLRELRLRQTRLLP